MRAETSTTGLRLKTRARINKQVGRETGRETGRQAKRQACNENIMAIVIRLTSKVHAVWNSSSAILCWVRYGPYLAGQRGTSLDTAFQSLAPWNERQTFFRSVRVGGGLRPIVDWS